MILTFSFHCPQIFNKFILYPIRLAFFYIISFSGFGERLLTEVKKLAPKDVKIKVGLLVFVSSLSQKGFI